MPDTDWSSEALVDKRYKTAVLFAVPLLAGFAMMILDGVWGISLLSPGGILLCILVGLVTAAVPATRYQRAKTALDRAKKKAQLAELASYLEPGK